MCFERALIRWSRINARSKHIAIHFHYVREKYAEGSFLIQHVESAHNLADICTKSLPRPTFQHLAKQIGLKSRSE